MKSENRLLNKIRGWLPAYTDRRRSLSAFTRVGILSGSVMFAIAVTVALQPWAAIFPSNPSSSNTGPVTILAAQLPTARSGVEAVYDGSKVYILGGDLGGKRTDQIVIFDPVKETVSLADVSLPYRMTVGSAVWTGKFVCMFGGSLEYIPDPDLVDNPPALDVIMRYDPSSSSVQVMNARLPSPRYCTSAVWDGKYVYVFGGGFGQQPVRYGGKYYDDILRYDPSTDTMEIMPAKLPTPRGGTSAFYDGEYIYVIGGETTTYYLYGKSPDSSVILGDILRYNPETDEVVTMLAYFHLAHTACVWNGLSAYIFGGSYATYASFGGSTQYDAVWEYTPGDMSFKLIANLPKDLSCNSAIWDGQNAYIFGGVKGYFVTSDILKFTPEIEPAG